jgi:hypothetical protein
MPKTKNFEVTYYRESDLAKASKTRKDITLRYATVEALNIEEAAEFTKAPGRVVLHVLPIGRGRRKAPRLTIPYDEAMLYFPVTTSAEPVAEPVAENPFVAQGEFPEPVHETAEPEVAAETEAEPETNDSVDPDTASEDAAPERLQFPGVRTIRIRFLRPDETGIPEVAEGASEENTSDASETPQLPGFFFRFGSQDQDDADTEPTQDAPENRAAELTEEEKEAQAAAQREKLIELVKISIQIRKEKVERLKNTSDLITKLADEIQAKGDAVSDLLLTSAVDAGIQQAAVDLLTEDHGNAAGLEEVAEDAEFSVTLQRGTLRLLTQVRSMNSAQLENAQQQIEKLESEIEILEIVLVDLIDEGTEDKEAEIPAASETPETPAASDASDDRCPCGCEDEEYDDDDRYEDEDDDEDEDEDEEAYEQTTIFDVTFTPSITIGQLIAIVILVSLALVSAGCFLYSSGSLLDVFHLVMGVIFGFSLFGLYKQAE